MKIKIDTDNCISCGSCASIAPNTFKLNEDNKSEVLDKNGDSDDKILEAAKSCPVSVITLYDAEGKKLWPEN
ncbi:ferredoxin [Patescibacteria group bacterium]|nr:ferredoxin [Patescibacteria group bacterium]